MFSQGLVEKTTTEHFNSAIRSQEKETDIANNEGPEGSFKGIREILSRT